VKYFVFGERAIIDCVLVTDNPKAEVELEAALRRLGLISEREALLAYEEVRDFSRMASGSFGAVFRVETKDHRSTVQRRTILTKVITTGFGEEGTARAVDAQVKRLHYLSAIGICTPRVYGSGRGTIYQDFIDGAAPAPANYPDELAQIAARLDFHGARPLNFLDDLVLRGGELYCVEAGSDFGAITLGLPPNPDQPARRALLDALPGTLRHQAETAYGHAIGQLRRGGAQ
jgi:hypothetical protein